MSFLFRARPIPLHQISAAAIGVVAALYTNGSSLCSKGFPERPQSPEMSILQIPSSRRPVLDRAAEPKPPFVPLDFVQRIRRCGPVKLPGAARIPPHSFRLRLQVLFRRAPSRDAAAGCIG